MIFSRAYFGASYLLVDPSGPMCRTFQDVPQVCHRSRDRWHIFCYGYEIMLGLETLLILHYIIVLILHTHGYVPAHNIYLPVRSGGLLRMY